MFGQTIQLTMEYNDRDVSDDKQIVEKDGHDEDSKYEESEDKDDESEEEEHEEPEGGEDKEKNSWVSMGKT